MNILMLTRCMGEGGTEKIIIQLCEILIEAGHSVIVCAEGGKGAETLQEMGVSFYNIPDMQKKNPVVVLHVIHALRKIMRENSIDIIHVHHRMAAFYCRFMRLEKRYKLVATSHNVFHDKVRFTQIAYRYFNVVACGECVRQNLQTEYGIRNIKVIHNAVRAFEGPLHPDPALKADREAGCFMVANIGRINAQKGMEYFVRAWKKVKQRHPRVRFYIVGTGVREQEMRALVLAEGAYVVFMGFRRDVQNIIAQMDLVVLSSLWEGLPLTPIEAFSMGKTIVATEVDGTVEVVQDGQNGVLVPPKDSDCIADMICWMIEHPEQRADMEKRARQTYLEKFSMDVFAKSYLEYYRSL